jgi:hypothetical protein
MPAHAPTARRPHLERRLADRRGDGVAAVRAAVLAAPDGQHDLVVREHLRFDRV